MEKIQVIEDPKGTFSSNVGISVEEWKDILSNPSITTSNYKDALMAFYNEPDHKSTCKTLSLKHYGNTKGTQKINSWITHFGKAVVKYLNRFQIIDSTGQERYWHVTMCLGRTTEDGLFETTLRPEIVQAIEIIGWNKRLTWIPFFTEMADKLLQFKDNRSHLLDIVYALEKSFVGYIKSDVDGGQVSDIDPFTVFGIFNRGITQDNRIKLCQYFKDKLNIEAPLPFDFDGVPVVNNMKGTFYYRNNISTDIQPLWDLFSAALTKDKKNFNDTFDIVSQQQGIKWNITMGLYWIRPYDYISLDSCNRDYLPTLGIDVFKENQIDSSHYIKLLKAIQENIENNSIKEKNIPEISYNAWTTNNNDTQKTGTNVNYWLLGHSFGSNNPQFDRFINEGIWEARFDENKPVDQRQLNLIRQIKVGDVLMLKSTAVKQRTIPFIRIKAVGIVTSVLEEIDGNEYKTCKCCVKYLSVNDKDFDGSSYGAYRQTVHIADDKAREIIEYANSIINKKNMPQKKYSKYLNLLKETHNLVLTGAPGTGKTYMAQAIANEMGCSKEEMCFVQFHPSYDYTDFVEGLRPIEKVDGQMGFERKDGVFKEFCKKAARNLADSKKTQKELSEERSFEEKYNELINKIENGEIDDFKLKTEGKTMEVVKVSDNKNIILRTPGTTTDRTYIVSLDRLTKISKEFPTMVSLNAISNINEAMRNVIGGCNASSYWAVLNEIYKQHNPNKIISSSNVPKKDFVFIIDEINRGEASKIFGELFYAIDPGYRGKKDVRVKTQYQNLVSDTDMFAEGFYVPENVYILATMNDIDRSVESMDFAMRRRFTWKEVTPIDTESMLDTLSCADEAKNTMHRLNSMISDTEGLGYAYQVGPSYFLKLADNGGDFTKLWNMNIEPLLKEYLRGFRQNSDILEKFKNAYFALPKDVDTDISDELE